MAKFLAGFHLLLGIAMCALALPLLGEHWKTPAFVLLAGGTAALVIGAGVLMKAAWARWFVSLLLLAAGLIGLTLLAGSLIWPEQVGPLILVGLAAFVALELITWHHLGRASRERGEPA